MSYAYLFGENPIPMESKMEFFKKIPVLILTHGCESWTMPNNYCSKTKNTEMKFLINIEGIIRKI